MYTVTTEGPFRSSAVPLLRVLSCSSQFSVFLQPHDTSFIRPNYHISHKTIVFQCIKILTTTLSPSSLNKMFHTMKFSDQYNLVSFTITYISNSDRYDPIYYTGFDMQDVLNRHAMETSAINNQQQGWCIESTSWLMFMD